jgi:thiamine pyrophosphate-dependent acetolactate synthase large subunit-like protein
VLLDFPIDVLFSPVHAKLIAWGSIASRPMFRPGPHEEAIKVAVELVATSKRPVIITGTGAKHPYVSLLNEC